jgi:hypothetical protein
MFKTSCYRRYRLKPTEKAYGTGSRATDQVNLGKYRYFGKDRLLEFHQLQ